MFGISFLSPLFLIGAAAAAIPIAIHLFYRRAEPVIEFAAMRYLRQARVEHARRRRLRELLLLALRVAALGLLAWAFARPYVSGAVAALSGGATIVLVDTSASMSGPGQFERARARAEAVIRGAPATHAVAVMSFAQTANPIAPLSQDRASALAAVAQLKPGAGATRYRAALQRAGEELGGRAGRIVVVTDLQQNGWDNSDGGVPADVSVEVEAVDGPESNVAITAVRAEGGDAVAVVQNYSQRPVNEQVLFAVDERRLGAMVVTLQPGGNAEARVPIGALESGALSASIGDREGFLADNMRYAVLDPANAVSVVALTSSGRPSESLYLERALATVDGAGGFRFKAVSASGFASLDAQTFADVDVIAVLGTRGLEQQGRERLAQFVRSGHGLLLTAGPDVEPAVIKQALMGVVATSWRARDAAELSFAPDDARHPVFRLFGGAGALSNVSFTRAALVDPSPSANVIARYTDGSPALVEERGAAGRVLLFGSDLNHSWNDFPLQPAFLPFVHEALRYLASPRDGRAEYVVGELAGPPGLTQGVVSVGSAGRRVAVNIDTREADPRRMTAEAFQSGISRLHARAEQQASSEARQQEDRQSLWRYGLLLMVVSLAVEGLLGRRLG
jgi:VWA domain-containing protein/aerotolerance regulator-like protein